MKQFLLRFKHWYTLALVGVILASVFAHFAYLTYVPHGLYSDEASIGLNADLIAHSGIDEHGVHFPIFFEAFGEYKNPLYIYTVAGVFKIFGTSELALRATSGLFMMIFLAIMYVLLNDMFKDRWIVLYGLIACSFTPWFFDMSRISFEVVSQLPVIAAALLCIYRAFQDSQPKKSTYIFWSGFLLAFSVYSYTTSRILSFLFFIALFLVYRKKATLRQWLTSVGGFLLASIPYIYFTATTQGAATSRLKTISFLFEPGLSVNDKFHMFVENFKSYTNRDFFFKIGDTAIRNHTGLAGELFYTTGILACIALGVYAYQIWKRKAPHYITFLLLCGIAVVLSISITTPAHSLRSVLLGLVLVILSGYGAAWLFERWGTVAKIGVLVLITLETSLYVTAYFTKYPALSTGAFATSGFEDVFYSIEARNPQKIYMVPNNDHQQIQADFDERTKSANTPITIAPAIAEIGSCYILLGPDNRVKNTENLPVTFSIDSENSHGSCY